jgi:hypothetical protein
MYFESYNEICCGLWERYRILNLILHLLKAHPDRYDIKQVFTKCFGKAEKEKYEIEVDNLPISTHFPGRQFKPNEEDGGGGGGGGKKKKNREIFFFLF